MKRLLCAVMLIAGWVAAASPSMATEPPDDALLVRLGHRPIGDCPLFRLIETSDAHALFERVAQLEGDRGARALIKDHPGVVRLPVDDPGCIVDIDTRDDQRVYARA